MRFFWKCKQFIKGLALFIFCLGAFMLFAFCSVEKFPLLKGSRTYYLDNVSSQALATEKLAFKDCFRVKGESVIVELETEGEAFAKELVESYGGKIVCVEKVGRIISYYAYAPALSNGVLVEGKRVNMHVAFEEGKKIAVVGNPIIFGGY